MRRTTGTFFLAAFATSFAGFTVAVSAHQPVPEPEPIPVVLAQQAPTEIPTPLPTPTITPKPTATPKPTSSLNPSPTTSPTPAPTQTPVPTQTPIPVPTATPDVWSPGHLEPWFAQYAGQYGVDKNALERIANCESHFNPNATNGDYAGMFQFATQTWINYRNQMGMDPNPTLRTNPEESIRTGAFMMSKRGTAPWPSCV